MGKLRTVIYLFGISKVNFSNLGKIMEENWLGIINTDGPLGKKFWSCLTRIFEMSRNYTSQLGNRYQYVNTPPTSRV